MMNLMKKYIIVILLIINVINLAAQNRKAPYKDDIYLGIKGGVNLASMKFTDKNLSSLPQNNAFRLLGGVFIDIPLTQIIGIAPEFAFVQRGMSTKYTHSSGIDVQYKINSNYVDFRLPVLFRFSVNPWCSPYLVGGVDAGYLLGGDITLKQEGMPIPEASVAIGEANMSPLYLGAFGGIGCSLYTTGTKRNVQFKLEAVYNHGFLDTFSDKEKDESATPVNVNAYNHTGKRFQNGIEISLSVCISLKKAPNDACAGWK